jgi:beta-mannosidase
MREEKHPECEIMLWNRRLIGVIRMNLNEDWELTYEDLSWGVSQAPAVLAKESGWMVCDIPCDVHTPLIKMGIIKEPNEALNSFECEWIEDRSWWFRKRFVVEEDMLRHERVELTLESLDAEADVFLNGFHLGHHRSAFYPFVSEIRRQLKRGENLLLIRVTSGLERVSEEDIAAIRDCVSVEGVGGRGGRGDKRRSYVRKPQYVYGWDWGPRIATCGIMKDVYVCGYERLAVRGVRVFTQTVSEDQARLKVKVEVENLHPYKSFDGVIRFELLFNDGSVAVESKTEHLRSGLNYISLTVDVRNPQLWWPNGMGEQALHIARVSVSSDDVTVRHPDFKYGIRTLKLNMDRINDRERLFAFEINGVKTFCKGANWIPADSIYGRVSDEKYDTLLREAKDAHFTMLRVWGGGLYEKDVFYEKCDAYGILIWQDFMFSCAMYPDYEEWFRLETEREMDYQTRRLRNHPCMALWSGCNENNWGFRDWWREKKQEGFFGGAICYNLIAPKIVERNCPYIPYWNGSPYGGENPNGNKIGDRHHWGDCTMNPDMEKRITPEEYDKTDSKFISEYGYIGPCAKSSIVRYHAGNPVRRDGAIWKHHTNTFEKDTVVAGISKHYIDADNLDLDGYLLYAGLCQGLMYQYSLEAIRYKTNCWGSLFWMYDDCWGEVGWTILDYYLKRKPSYYYVKRAFAPLKLILREVNGLVNVMGVNDTGKPASFEMEYGYVSFDGSARATKKEYLTLPPYSRGIVFQFEKGAHDFLEGICFVKPEKVGIEPATLRTNVFRNLHVIEASLRVRDVSRSDGIVSFTVSSDTYAHAVHFGLEEGMLLSDEYFDLLPGESRRIEVLNASKDFRTEEITPICVVV